MRDLINYSNGHKWKWRKGNSHYDVRLTRSERGWKANTKRRHQYKPIVVA